MCSPERNEHSLMSCVPWSNERERLDVIVEGQVSVKELVVRGVLHPFVRPPRRMLRRRIRKGHPFAFLGPPGGRAEPIPPANNPVESWNAGIRDMLRRHRGLRLIRRIKAICWWCHHRTEHPETAAWPAGNATADQRIEEFYEHAWETSPQGAWETYGIPMRYGTGIDWNEFHTQTRPPTPPNDPTTGHTIWPITRFRYFICH